MKQREPLKPRLQRRELTFGTWQTLGDPGISEILCQAGFDWITIDMEHSAITLAEAASLIRVIDLAGAAPLVRVGSNEPTLIKRVLDAGAEGVIVPMVNTAAEAASAVAAACYPPKGQRGVGLARAQAYGTGFAEYSAWQSEYSVVIVQIEHIDAVSNLREILAVPGVDGFIIGPYDLSGSLGKPGRYDEPDVRLAIESIDNIAREMNALSGFHVVPVDFAGVAERVQRGDRFIAHSLDSLWLKESAKGSVQQLHQIRKDIDL